MVCDFSLLRRLFCGFLITLVVLGWLGCVGCIWFCGGFVGDFDCGWPGFWLA